MDLIVAMIFYMTAIEIYYAMQTVANSLAYLLPK